MYFQLNTPSIPAIRAKFLIEKLRAFGETGVSISLCATGRTGSGKTTLGNRLIGIDYFMPSTGRQDCTDEVNLVEFPIGLRYFDLPGVCSDDRLENYNRAALGIKQLDDFDIIDTLTLAKYKDSQSPQRQKFSVSHFQTTQLNPDLIFYLIAPDKQFLSIDSAYLRHLLKKHRHKIIYIFNIFTDKETGQIFSATEQNIRDVTTRIQKVHTAVLGSDSPPIIVPVNCWTGEGVSDLVTYAHQLLGDEKGFIFETLIQYQQDKTPDDYLYQIKQELIRLFAYAACQKPDAGYTCNQPIHQVCHTLWDFLSNFRNTFKQSDFHLIDFLNSLIGQVLAEGPPIGSSQVSVSAREEDMHSIEIGLEYIGGGIEYLNEELNSRLIKAQQAAIEFRDLQVKNTEQDIEHRGKDISTLEESLVSNSKQYDSLIQKIHALESEINSCHDKRNSLVGDFNSLNENIGSKINTYNSKTDEFRIFAIELDTRINNFNARMQKYQVRLHAYNSSVDKINSSPYYVSQSTINSLEAERDFLRRESNYLSNENTHLDEQIRKRDNTAAALQTRESDIQADIRRRDNIDSQISYQESHIERLRQSGIEEVKAVEQQQKIIQQDIKLRSEKIKALNDYIEFSQEIFDSFSRELSSILEQKDSRIDEINGQLNTIKIFVEKYQQETAKLDLASFQREIFDCIENMSCFADEINSFIDRIDSCTIKTAINRLIMETIIHCTTNHFDSTGDCEYKGSTYQSFGEKGVILLLTITHLIIREQNLENFHQKHNNFDRVNFENFVLAETEIQKKLQSQVHLLFDSVFDQQIKKFVL